MNVTLRCILELLEQSLKVKDLRYLTTEGGILLIYKVMIMLILQVITEQITFYMVMRQVEDTYGQDNQVNHLFHKVGIPN